MATRGQGLTRDGTVGMTVVDRRIDGMKDLAAAAGAATARASVGGRVLGTAMGDRTLKHLVYQVSARRPGQPRRLCRIGRGRIRQERRARGRDAVPRAYMFGRTLCPIIH